MQSMLARLGVDTGSAVSITLLGGVCDGLTVAVMHSVFTGNVASGGMIDVYLSSACELLPCDVVYAMVL